MLGLPFWTVNTCLLSTETFAPSFWQHDLDVRDLTQVGLEELLGLRELVGLIVEPLEPVLDRLLEVLDDRDRAASDRISASRQVVVNRRVRPRA